MRTPSNSIAPVRQFRNAVLKRLDPETLSRLCLRPVEFEQGRTISLKGDNVRHLVFLETGVASLLMPFQDGSQVEAGIIGCESVVGFTALLGDSCSPHDTVMQVSGQAYCGSVAQAAQEFGRPGSFQRLVLACLRLQLAQSAQLAGCYARHEVMQRLSRWLLMCADRLGRDEIPVTQEALGRMLGASRSTISLTCEALESRGIIMGRRGHLRILDRPALMQTTCECYHLIRAGEWKASPEFCKPTLPEGPQPTPIFTERSSPRSDSFRREGMLRSRNYVQ